MSLNLTPNIPNKYLNLRIPYLINIPYLLIISKIF